MADLLAVQCGHCGGPVNLLDGDGDHIAVCPDCGPIPADELHFVEDVDDLDYADFDDDNYEDLGDD